MQRTILIFVAVLFVLEFYVYQAFKTLFVNRSIRMAYWIITLGIYAFCLSQLLLFTRAEPDRHRMNIIAVIFLAFMVPKLLVTVMLIIDDLIRLSSFAYQRISGPVEYYPARRKFLSAAGLGIMAVFTGLILDGVIFGKFRHQVRLVKIKIKNLPQAFRGYRIVQISDVHSGSFEDPEKLRHAIDLINEQNADLVLFTGDLVNNLATEFEPFVPLFSQIKAKDGKLSVLGNHDYGSYVEWKSPADKAQNLRNLGKLQAEAGFRLLKNEHIAIDRDGEKLYILGVENWGEKPFPQYGDLTRAAAGIPPTAAKILMSHDPTHFDHIVKKHPADIALTLSGHTHGMQFGIDLKNWRWSPVKYRYKKWADLYESEGKYLYVNRGFGVLGYPGRVGIKPEITVFELS